MIPFFKLSWRKWVWVWLGGSCLFGASLMAAPARAAEPVSLTVQLRYSDGTAVIGEPISLERLPDEDPIAPTCLTDTSGRCTWPVGRGLYQLLFERPLDAISELALAEGGLRGFGVTVGEASIAYHFTFHSDGRVYFDAAPEAAVPSPVIPVGEVLHGGVVPTQVPLASVTASVATPPTSEATRTPEMNTAVGSSTDSGWRLLLFIGSGLALGGSLHLWSRQRQAAKRHAPTALGKSASPPVAHQAEETDA